MLKQIVSAVISMLIAGSVMAQGSKPAVQKNETQTVKSVAAEATLASFESVLSDGQLLFSKKLSKNSSGTFSATYFLQLKRSSFNNGKPFEIVLNKDAFDNYFQKGATELASKWPQLAKFAQDKQLSYTDEESWIKIIKYLNSL